MNRSQGNIDLVFRNGLKDYEVLPPEGVWKNVKPVLNQRRVPLLLRSAALIASFISIGIIAFVLGRKSASFNDTSLVSFNISHPEPYFVYEAPEETGFGPLRSRTTERTRRSHKIEIQTPVADIMPSNDIIITEESGGRLAEYIDKVENNIIIPDVSKPVDANYLAKIGSLIAGRWSIEASASPTHYSITGGAGALTRQLHNSEKPLSSYTGGLKLSYRINRRFSIQTGLFYASQGQRVTGVNSYTGFSPFSKSKGSPNFELKTISGPVQIFNPDVFLSVSGDQTRMNTNYNKDVFDPQKANLSYLGSELIQNFSYLQMPFILRYKLIDKNLDINLAGGVSYDFLIKNDAYTNFNGVKYIIGETKGVNNLAISSIFALGFEYGISGDVSFNVEPTFRYYINPFTKATEQKIHPYSFGVFTGFSFSF